MIDDISDQTEDLCHIHDHVTRVITNLDIDPDCFSDYADSNRAKFGLEPIVRMFLYKYARGFNQSELERRLRGAAYVYIRLGLRQPLSQQVISHNERNRFTSSERRTLKEAAERIREVCAEHDIVETDEPPLEPQDLQAGGDGLEEKQIMSAVERATELGFDEFTAGRASNCKYALEAYFERQGYLNMARAGTTTPRRRFERLSDRSEVPHGSSHNRTMKKVADPNSQLSLKDFADSRRTPDWKRIRNEVLPMFHVGVGKQLDEIAGRDRQGIRQPVVAAIDITRINFWPPPFTDERPDTDAELIDVNEREVYRKAEYPEMVSGFRERGKRGYKFATLSIIAEDTPIILAIEPVRDYRAWERRDKDEVETTSTLDLVDGLLEQAEQHVDIHKLVCDRGFDSHGVRDRIDRRDIRYVTGKRSLGKADYENIKEISQDSVYDTRIEHAKLTYEGRTHKVSLVYLPGGKYSVFTINGWISPDRAQALTEQYRQRWVIENEYKTIKQHFLPIIASTDYRIRFLYFVIAVILYNTWRLSNFVLRDEVSVDLGDEPPLRAGEIVELVGFFLFDPG
jgi:hypothetical protein